MRGGNQVENDCLHDQAIHKVKEAYGKLAEAHDIWPHRDIDLAKRAAWNSLCYLGVIDSDLKH